ncbi:molybdopterin molybdotransferase MoeA [Shimia marina]|uniref:Molybdopterin molybdenumtransferase n=1 Tax=Shimia marina TaxID=321267 RepID=A0A0P1ESX4_9RHOB|nr:gephyrin-like molybdotransferase Glp [Shimia marina]CUH53537.1 Molybdopterin molybdenumtransferase [Shimia marina]SFD74836.1 molybdopterin molybdotransferase [Shimia marina]
MISVPEALAHLFSLTSSLETETVPLGLANGRVLASAVTARRDQPPFAASAMDGYGVGAAGVVPGARYKVIGEAAAGHSYAGTAKPGEAVRIFTGAPVPDGVDRVIIQEDVTRKGDVITLSDRLNKGTHIRPAGGDFKTGQTIEGPRLLRPSDVALMAAMNIAEVPVTRRPKVAILSTGDELVMPGETPNPDQIIASNSFGLQAMLRNAGAEARLLPIAKDTKASLRMAFELIDDADLLITIGGASVGDHDLVGDVAQELGMGRRFYKIAMRPGKPLMAGSMANGAMMIGLPGNPVSAMVCGHVFVLPVIRAMLGLGEAPSPRLTAPLATALPANGPREHYMRARLQDGQLHSFGNQDSSLLTILSEANALIVCPPNAAKQPAGTPAEFIQI